MAGDDLELEKAVQGVTGGAINPFASGGGAQPKIKLPPEEAPKTRKVLIDGGMPEAKADYLIDYAIKYDMAPIIREVSKYGKTKAPTKAAVDPEVLRQRMIKRWPQYATQLQTLPPETLMNTASSLAAREFAKPKEPKQPTGFHIDRSKLPPGMQKFAPMMTDEAISGIAKKEFERSQEPKDTGNYPRHLIGKKLNIVQDDAFNRSGLKTGDTVCIKIP